MSKTPASLRWAARSMSRLPGFTHLFALLVATCVPLSAQAPDLTSGGEPTSSKYWNLGPTGMQGWFHHVSASTNESRQILVTTVEAGSPADGILAVNDVILGASGTGADPMAFSSDARKSLALAIADAEAATPATLKLLRWRAGLTSVVSLDMETLGAYSATAPYNCPKSAAILEKGLDAIMAGGQSDNYKLSLITLLAGNDPSNPDNAARQARASQEAHELILTPAQIAEYTSGNVLTTSKVAWTVGFKMVALAEYYLHTGDPAVYDSLRAYAIAYANGQSMFGTGGHQFAKQGKDGSVNGPYGVGYGVVNSANMQCFYGLLLAREAGITDPEIGAAIERASRFYGGYVERGSIPYGEHGPGGGHESNGKCGIAALCFQLEGTREDARSYYSRMAGASAGNRDAGHTGPYLNYLWAPLGANVGGEEAMAAYFSESSWMFDLARKWDGSFEYNTYGQGNNGGANWGGNLQMSMAVLLTYATPLREIHSTGKNQDPQKWMTPAEVDAVTFAATYDASARTTSELLGDLGHWSPPTRRKAAAEIGLRTSEHATLLPILHNMAASDPGLRARVGACFALGSIADDSSAAVLANLLTDPENLVRWASAAAMRNLSQQAKLAEINTMLAAAASTATPLLPLNEEDPIHLAHSNLAMLLFYAGGASGPSGVLSGHDLVGIDRSLLYPAIRAVAATPLGMARSSLRTIYPKLTRQDVEAVADAMVDGAMYEAPADRMFSESIRTESLATLQRYNISEGVPLSRIVANEIKGPVNALVVLQDYAGSSLSVKPNPKIVEFCEFLIANDSNPDAARAILDAIAADRLPAEPVPFKGINWIFPDQPTLTLPESWTVLRVDAYDHAKGDSIYTWRKVHGAGDVSFTPNGTAAAANATVVFDGTPGQYIFEVTMSDSKGLTEVAKTVAVTLLDAGGTLPANNPPTADSQLITAGQGTPTPIILTGSDPEGFALSYEVLTQPAHGLLSGAAPHLVYVANADHAGADSFGFMVTDSEGQVATSTVDITVDPVGAIGLAVYEPFNYPAGDFHNASGTGEIGLAGAWAANSSIKLVAGSLDYGTLITEGGSIGNLASGSTFGGARMVSATALAGNGLLDDGASLWFSMMVGPGPSSYGTSLFVALANNSFSTSNNSYWIADDGGQPGSGLGISLLGSSVVATRFRDSASGGGTSGHIHGEWNNANGSVLGNQGRLVVGKINWGAGSDTVAVYLPKEDMTLPETPSSVLSVDVDQSAFDTLTFARAGAPVLDEIRFGPTYQSVLQGTSPMVRDVDAPSPDPMTFAVAPAPAGPSSITMSATPAFDPLGVEYYFTCTAGGGNDSGWQESHVYTDSGLTPGVTYSYTVKARDKQPGPNETSTSAVASATIPSLGTVPAVAGMPQAAAESSIIGAGFVVGAITTATEYSLTVPAGHVISQSPSGDSSAAYGLAVELVISIGEDPALPDLAAADIVDDQGGGPVEINLPLTYTLTFSQDMDAATVDAADFTNAGDASVSIGSITEISPGIFTVEVTPTSTGLLRFAIAEGAVLTDTLGNALNTSRPLIDDTTIVVNLPPVLVPDVVGLAQAAAEVEIVAANLALGNVYQIFDESVAAGLVISQNPSAGAGIPGQSPVDLVVSLGTPPDTTPPVIASLDPFDGENNVEIDGSLTVYFDEDIVPGSGNIVIRNLSDFSESIIPVTDASQVFISGVVMTLVPAEVFLPGKSYAVRISPGAVADLSGNPFGGINDNAAWNFSTAVTSQQSVLFAENFEAPDVAGYTEGTSPANWVRASQGFGATRHGLTDKAGGDFNAAAPNHQAYAFRYGNSGLTTAEGVIATVAEGITYELTFDVIRDDGANAGTPYNVEMIAYDPGAARNDCRSTSPGILLAAKVGDATSNGSFSTVSLRYTVPSGSAAIGKDLAVRLKGAATSAIIDNVSVATVNPNPLDEVPPVVTSFEPAPGTTNFPVANNLVLRFDEDVIRGSGYLTIKNLTDATETNINMLDGSRVIISGPVVTINPPEDLVLDRFYAVRIPANAIFDLAGNPYEGIHNDTRWGFSTGEINDVTSPTLVSVSPANGASDVPYAANFTANFDESVIAGTGSITLRNLTDGTQVVIDVTDESQVRISGPSMVVNPNAYLEEGKNHAIWITPGAITDLSGNAHAGIENDNTWNFTTSAINPPAIVSLDPADESVNIDPAAGFSVTFDENVMAGAGNIVIRNINDAIDLTINITDASQVSITGPVVTIQPTTNLPQGRNHAILIDPGAIRDLDGNGFAGIINDGVWNFVTGVSTEGAVFSDDFEAASGSPDVDATGSLGNTSGQTGPKWIRTSGSFGSDRHGIVDESSGQFTDPTGDQAYAFRYTNSGITTVPDVIGALTSGATYSVSFYVVMDGHNSGSSYKAELVTFGEGASRTNASSNQSMILASSSGSYTGTNYQLVTFEYTSDGVADAAVKGHDVALRFAGATTSANIDNVQVAVTGGGAGDTTPPTLASTDIVDDKAGAAVNANTLVTYTVTFSEAMDETTVDASDFGNAGTSALAIGTVTETSPGVFAVQATPTTNGTLQLQVNAGAVLADVAGNALDATVAIVDDTVITVETGGGGGNSAPVWAGNPILEANATQDMAYSSTLTDDASDIDGDMLSFAKVSGPVWLNVAINGALTGTPGNADVGTNNFIVSISDGIAAPLETTLVIDVINVNDAPVASSGSGITNENTAVAITLIASDIDGDVLTYAVVTTPTNGTLSGAAPNLTYTPNAGYSGSDSFTFMANDGLLDSNTATVSITVNAVNDAPVFAADPFSSADATEDVAYSTTIAGSASDADGDALTYAKVSGPAWLGVGLDGALSGTPLNADVGINSFTVSASDGTATTQATLTINVINVNDAPTWNSNPIAEAGATVDTAYSGSLAGDATDADGDPLTYAMVSGPTWLTVAIDGSLSGIPTSTDLGINSFTVNVSDGISIPVEVTLTIEVAEPSGVTFADNFEPGVNPFGGTTPDVAAYTVGNTSRQANPTLWVRASSGFGADRNGLIDESENSGLNFTDPAGAQAYGFRYTNSGVTTAAGVIGALSAGTTINVSFDVVLDGFNGGTGYDALLVLFDAGATRSAMEFGEKGTAAVLARVTGNAPTNGSYATVSFTYVVGDPVVDNDGGGANMNTAFLTTLLNKDIALRFKGATTCANIDNVSMTVSGGSSINIAPVWSANPVLEANATEDASYASTLSDDASDADGDLLTFAKVSGPAWLAVGTDGALSGTPLNSDVGTNSFTVSASDGTATTHATLTITVITVNDAPVADGQSVATNEDTAVAIILSASDVDGDALTYTVLSAPPNGTLSGIAPNLTYTPNANYNGSDSFTFVANDGLVNSNPATVSIAVNAVNDAPVADGQSVATNEDAAVAIILSASDVDGDALTYTVLSAPPNGTLSGIAPNLTYTPNANYNGSDSFTFVANDGLVNSNPATVSIAVNAVNDAPVFAVNPFSTPDATADEAYSASIAGAANDVDGDLLTYSKVSGPAWLFITPGGGLSGTPSATDIGSNSFIVSASDGTLAADASLVINVVQALATVPDVVGLTQAAAESSIINAALAVGMITQEHSNVVPAGNVISQGLAAGASVPQGSEVDLVVSLGAASSAKLVRTTISAVSNTGWTTVDLGNTYTSPIIIATPIYPNSTLPPVVTRIRNVTTTGFDLRVARADGQTGPVSFEVSIVAIEEGVYTQVDDGVTMEAVKFTSVLTAYSPNNWSAETRSFQNNYTSPVVMGQVMSANDPNWSVFWSMGGSRAEPVDAVNFNVGKHVGQDTNLVRANETIGYIVIEAGNGSIDGIAYEAGLGAKTVQSFGDSTTPYTYPLSGTLNSIGTVAVSQSGMNGNDGSWVVLSGSPAVTTTTLGLHVAEDAFKDNRRRHAAEHVAYIVFE